MLAPPVVVLRADIMQRLVLDAVADFLRQSTFASERFPGAPQISIGDNRDDATITLSPDKAVKGVVANRYGRVLRRGPKREPVWRAAGCSSSLTSR